MAAPRITVVLACFNNADHLESSLCSVLDQQYENLELIVVDGSAQDHTTATLRHYRSEIDLWIRERCQSMAQTINMGLARAEGDIVAVMQSGDIYLHGALQAMAETIARGANWAIGQCQRLSEFDERLSLCEPQAPTSLAAFLRHDSGMLPGASSFWKRSITQQLGLLDESLNHCFEYDYWCRMLAAGHKPVIVNQVMAARREYIAEMDAQATLAQGREYIQIALRHAHHLSSTELYHLLRNCDRRSRIYALAEADQRGDVTRVRRLRTLLRQPWHLMDEAIRHVVIHGRHGSAPAKPEIRPAA